MMFLDAAFEMIIQGFLNALREIGIVLCIFGIITVIFLAIFDKKGE